MFDVTIVNGLVVDGTGTPKYRADVGVAGGTIAAIGDLSAAEAEQRLDAAGLVVAPGFIDPHAHSDLPLLINGRAESKVRQGVTTEVVGNCGYSPAPITGPHRDGIIQMNAFLAKGSKDLDWDWRTMGGYLERLERQGVAINVVPLVGHVTLRADAMGFGRRPPAPEEMERMRALVRQALDEGVLGLSTGLIYPPSSYADTEELVELAKVVAAEGGYYFSHIRGEGATLLRAVSEAIEIGDRAGLPIQIAHHKVTGQRYWGRIRQATQLSDWGQDNGVDVTFDVYPYTASSTMLANLVPSWAHEGGQAVLIERLRDPATRVQIREQVMRQEQAWDKIYVSWVPSDRNKAYEGMTLAEIGERRKLAPVDAALATLVEEEGSASMIRFAMHEDDVRHVIKHPLSMIGSDGSSLAPYGPLGEGKPHPRNYGTFPRVLQVYVREQGLLGLEEAVAKMTGRTAAKLRLRRKGLVRVGLDADLVAFDPAAVRERATFSDPHQYPEGIPHVLVNGRLVVRGGEHTGALPGRVLRRGE